MHLRWRFSCCCWDIYYISYILSSCRILKGKRIYSRQEITYDALSLLNDAIGPLFKAKMNCAILVIICPMFWNIPEDLVHLCLLTIPSTLEKKIKNKKARMMDLSEGWYNYRVRLHCSILNFLYGIIQSFTTSFRKVWWKKSSHLSLYKLSKIFNKTYLEFSKNMTFPTW